VHGCMAVAAEQLGLVLVPEERNRSGIHEREVAVLVDDVEAVRGLLGDPQGIAVSDGRPAR
jgi:hypothetical protein